METAPSWYPTTVLPHVSRVTVAPALHILATRPLSRRSPANPGFCGHQFQAVADVYRHDGSRL
ncbi:hypothetical protein NLX62_04475, partial [Mycobacteriaceae bacterium Msp059]|nr:hypothetical protein [Mycobacteriaceae bacterium Msp059]